MRVQGPIQAPLPQPPRWRKRAPEKPQPLGDDLREPPQARRLPPDVDYISSEETLTWDERELSQKARFALQGYWSVAHQGHLWADYHRVDIYV